MHSILPFKPLNHLTKSSTKSGSVRLVQLTDQHLYEDSGRALRGVPTLPALYATLAAAASDIADCDAILATGDLVQDDPGGYRHFREAFAPLDKPVLCLPGNHDLVPQMREALGQPPFRLDGHVDMGAWRIVLLDSCVPGEVGGHLDAESLMQLDAVLTSAPELHALIALHHHPVPVGSRWLDNVGLDNSAELFEVLDRHAQVRGVVFGHVHQALEMERRGVRYLATPSTCSQFRPQMHDFAVDDAPPAWRLLELHADGRIGTSIRWLEGLQEATQLA